MSNILHFNMGEKPIGLNPAISIFENKELFPEFGNTQILYIDKEQNLLYYWTGAAYKVVGSANVICLEEKPTEYAIGGLPAGEVLYGQTWDKILQRILYVADNPEFELPQMTFTIDRYLYDLNDPKAVIGINIKWNRGRIVPAYGTDGYYAGPATAFGCNGILGYATEDEINAVVPIIVDKTENRLAIWVEYKEGEQPTNSHGQPYNVPYPAGRADDVAIVYAVPPIYRDETEDDKKEDEGEIDNTSIEPTNLDTSVEDNTDAEEEPTEPEEPVEPQPFPYVEIKVANTITEDGKGVELDRIDGVKFYLKDFSVAEIQLFDAVKKEWIIAKDEDIIIEDATINEELYVSYLCNLPVKLYPYIRFYILKISENEDGEL